MALEFLRAALRLEIRGNMADDNSFLGKFAGVFQNLAVVFSQNGLCEASLLCCRKAIAVYPSPGAYVNFTNALAATGGRARLSDFTTDIASEQLGRHIFIACLPKSAGIRRASIASGSGIIEHARRRSHRGRGSRDAQAA